jgi:hypothetical protein
MAKNQFTAKRTCQTCGSPLHKGKFFCSLGCRRRLHPIPLRNRLLKNVEFMENGCWLWTGYRNKKGYGGVWTGPGQHEMTGVHRVAYELFVGPIPDGLEIDHICHRPEECRLGIRCQHRRCVNPKHLIVTTHLKNVARAALNNGPGRSAARIKRISVNHCKYGHEYTVLNCAKDKKGARVCRECSRIKTAKWRAQRSIAAET